MNNATNNIATESKTTDKSVTSEKNMKSSTQPQAKSTEKVAQAEKDINSSEENKRINSLKKLSQSFNKIIALKDSIQLKSRMSAAKNFYKKLTPRNKLILTGSAGVLILLVVAGSIDSLTSQSRTPTYSYALSGAEGGNSHQAKPTVDPVLAKLNHIEHQMTLIQKQQSTNNLSSQNLSELNQNIISLKQAVAALETNSPNSVAEIQTLVTNSNQALSGQLNSIQQTVDALKKQATPKHYLPASILPWAIEGIDVRNFKPVVVRANGFDAMTKGDVRDGWQLIDVRFDPARAVFQSIKNPSNYVKVQ
jgi:hypothetical protein